MGMLEDIAASLASLHEKVDALSKAAPKAATGGKGKDKDTAPPKPEFTAEQLRDQFLAVQQKHGDAAAKALIADMGHSKLANLIGDTANWQKYWDAATARLADEPEGDDNGGL